MSSTSLQNASNQKSLTDINGRLNGLDSHAAAVDTQLNRYKQTVHVELNGSDNGDGSSAAPFATVGRALLEATGTTRVLSIVLGSGVHNAATLELQYINVEITGSGSLNFNTIKGFALARLHRAELSFDVPVTNTKSATYLAVLSYDSSLFISDNITLTGVSALFLSNTGYNSYTIISSTIKSSKSAVKFHSASKLDYVFLREQFATFVNIKG